MSAESARHLLLESSSGDYCRDERTVLVLQAIAECLLVLADAAEKGYSCPPNA